MCVCVCCRDCLSQTAAMYQYAGLDAFAALSVMQVMQKLARSGRTVVASIHQPRR